MHPILFHVGSFPVRAYGLVILLAIFLATQVSITLARLTVKEYEQHIVPLVYSVVIGALIGARVWQVFFFTPTYYFDPVPSEPSYDHRGTQQQFPMPISSEFRSLGVPTYGSCLSPYLLTRYISISAIPKLIHWNSSWSILAPENHHRNQSQRHDNRARPLGGCPAKQKSRTIPS